MRPWPIGLSLLIVFALGCGSKNKNQGEEDTSTDSIDDSTGGDASDVPTEGTPDASDDATDVSEEEVIETSALIVEVTTPTSPQYGEVTIDYLLFDERVPPINGDMVVEYSLDGSAFSLLKIACIRGLPKNGHVIAADAEALPFGQSPFFDIIVSSEVLEHVANPAEMLLQMHNVLKDDGIVIITVPMHVVDAQNKPLIERSHDLGDATHRGSFYSYDGLLRLFEENHFSVLEVRKDPYYIFKLSK